MHSYRLVVERDPETGVLVGYAPGWPGAHTQGSDMDELQQNLREVIEMLLEDGQPTLESEFVDVRTVRSSGTLMVAAPLFLSTQVAMSLPRCLKYTT
jgi:predicted RNase H-like HicB family nuclease